VSGTAGSQRAGWEAAHSIAVASNVRLGGGVIVLSDVTTGGSTVVGGGSVVTRNLPPDAVAMGGTTRVARTL
jgi:maltose O-acetyltransferase